MRCLSDALNSRRCGQRFKRHAAYTSVSLAALSLAAGLMLGANTAWAQSVTATGNVTPSGATSPNWTTSSIVVVGATGIGSLAIADGGTVSSLAAYIGHSASGRGTATVSGAGSLWSSTNGVYVGVAGIASLAITAGGVVTSNSDDYTGQLAGSDGNVTVSGTGSRWTSTSTLFVGNAGAGSLDIINGGVVDNRDAYIGYWSGGTGSVSVSGAGSTWTLAGPLTVGNAGSGSLSIAAGGVVSSSNAYVGDWSGGVGTATVNGAGSSWNIGNSLYVGGSGSGSLSITGGGSVNSFYGFIAADAGSTGTVNVSGAGSQWIIPSDFTVADAGIGSLAISGGGTVSSGDSYIGLSAGGFGTVTVSGAGSIWNAGDLKVGHAGTGTLTIESGGRVGSQAILVGSDVGGVGTVTVTGAGSSLGGSTSTGAVLTDIGFYGSGTLNVERGGKVFANQFTLGFFDSGMGAATVTGAGSSLSADTAYVGVFGVGTLAIADGGAVTSSFASIGTYAGSIGAATVTGAGSIWTNSARLQVGTYGSGTLTVADGGTLISESGFIGTQPGSVGKATVTGAGSSWANDGDLQVGHSGTGTLTIESGGTVNSGLGYIGLNQDSDGTVKVSDAGSKWTNAGNLYVGYAGVGTLTIADGGTVSSAYGIIGFQSGGVGTATVTGTGSSWTNSSDLTVGDYGTGTLTIADGGLASAGAVSLGFGAGSTGVINIGTGGVSGTLITPAIVGGAGDATVNFNHSDDIAFAPQMSGSLKVNQIGFGATILTGANSYGGLTTISAGTLGAGAANVFSPNSQHDVGPGGTLDLRGFDQTVGGLSNAGAVSLRGTGPGTTLTVNGAYVSNGGSLALNTALGDNGSATDRLAAGSVALGSGATRLNIANIGGLGALTTGNGIEIVNVANPAASAAGAFTLGNRVAASAYEYTLGRSMTAGADGNWYLRSTYTGPVVPPVTPPVTPPATELPNYRVEVPVDMVVPALANRLGLAMLGTCADRTMSSPSGSGAPACGADRPGTAMWARIFGETGSVGFGGRSETARFSNFESHGPSYDVRLGGFQAGMDLWRSPTQGGGLDTAGFYVGAGRIDSDVKAVYGGKAGSTSMDGYTLGAYWTRRAASGWYVDAVAQGTRYDQIEARSIYAETLKTSGWGFTASLETGYPIAFGAGWTIEPQAQLIYQHIAIDDTGRDRFGLIKYDDVDAVYGKLGGRLSKSWTLGDGRSVTTWARANLWHAFGAQATTTFSSLDGLNPVALKTDLGGSWGQVGLGVSGQLARNVTVFAMSDYNFALDAGKGTSLSGRVGATFTW